MRAIDASKASLSTIRKTNLRICDTVRNSTAIMITRKELNSRDLAASRDAKKSPALGFVCIEKIMDIYEIDHQGINESEAAYY